MAWKENRNIRMYRKCASNFLDRIGSGSDPENDHKAKIINKCNA